MTIKDRKDRKLISFVGELTLAGRGPGVAVLPLRVMSLSAAIWSHGPSDLYPP